jgi:hypothetical protein
METKEWFLFSVKMLAWSGTGAGIGGKDAGEMENSAQGGQTHGDGQLHWGTGAAWSKDAKDHERYGTIRFGSVFICSVPSGLQRCKSGGTSSFYRELMTRL